MMCGSFCSEGLEAAEKEKEQRKLKTRVFLKCYSGLPKYCIAVIQLPPTARIRYTHWDLHAYIRIRCPRLSRVIQMFCTLLLAPVRVCK